EKRRVMYWRLTLGLLLLTLISGGAKYALDANQAAHPPAPQVSLFDKLDVENRLTQAKELLGKYYQRSVVKNGELADNIDGFINKQVEGKLPVKWKTSSPEISQTIMFEARRYGFDPLFLVAVIDGESAFNPTAKGPVGEIGMMQLRNATGAWIAKRYHMPWRGAQSLKDPVVNIQLGAAYLAHLRDEFDSHSRLYLSAYNMGAKNVSRSLHKNVWPKDYPQHVMRRYIKLYTKLKKELLGDDDADRTSASDGPPVGVVGRPSAQGMRTASITPVEPVKSAPKGAARKPKPRHKSARR
ncbi:MAG TPA: lytic transglycosylase domain-containing protein, partial [Bdellovibrionota bacterium]|nr:lytic transglycosylase domain-containing protein [Bdellovibrionota bacterium]